VPDIYDSAKYDAIHNSHLAPLDVSAGVPVWFDQGPRVSPFYFSLWLARAWKGTSTSDNK